MLIKLTIATSLFFFISSCNNQKDSNNQLTHRDTTYLGITNELVKEGQYEEALQRYIWYDKHILEYDTGQKGVRRSFALSYWKDLGDVYPPAMDSMIKFRDEKTDSVLANGNSKELFADVVALNKYLKENKKSVDLFEVVVTRYPGLAKEVTWYALDNLLEMKRYDLLQKSGVNPVDLHKIAIDRYKRSIDIKDPIGELVEYLKDNFVERSLAIIKYCQAINDTESAKEIQMNALAIIDDHRLKKAIK